ncbi:hypothetical protein BJ944DRAFT_245411 [Cunninghamella echinulata]|nr:hypothetical protein BJ944DRAFT_245411 [Cunninghamella echinulata]
MSSNTATTCSQTTTTSTDIGEKTTNGITTNATESITTIYDKSITNEKRDGLSNIAEIESNKEYQKTGTSNEGIDLSVEDPNNFEEKRYGWLVVLGAFMVQVTSFGTATSCVMQNYYQKYSFGPSQQLNLSFVG